MQSFAYQAGYNAADYKFNTMSFGYNPSCNIRIHFEQHYGDNDQLYDEFMEGFNEKIIELR